MPRSGENQFGMGDELAKVDFVHDSIRLSYDGQEYRFQDGRLRDLHDKASNTTLSWRYDDDGKCKGIYDETGKELVRFSREKIDGQERLKVLQAGGKNGSEPLLATINYFSPPPLSGGYLSKVDKALGSGYVSEICVNSNQFKLDRASEADETEHLEVTTKESGQKASYAWLSHTGWLKKINDITYEVINSETIRIGEHEKILSPKIIQYDKKGEPLIVQNFQIGTPVGWKEILPNGGMKEYIFTMLPGGGKMLRKIELRQGSGDVPAISYNANYNAKAELIRESNGDYTRTYQNGIYKVYKNGTLVREYPGMN
ncbi:MAG: hypothetical protein B7Z37_18205 [Verrucomicrobia bacterium 12-59-8]|nr:MAG: hypothetical protein B7Z37_18205 [Verrucomicrobia bacterium 12-59-8]